jgi:cellulose synthase/poly-beta-1,6-N-acetylglucosamine synthase-like glycosyltransferase
MSASPIEVAGQWHSTEATARLARQAGAVAWEPAANVHKKARALNQALVRLLPHLADEDFIFIQDADTLPAPRWLEIARDWADKHPCAVISGKPCDRVGAGRRRELMAAGKRQANGPEHGTTRWPGCFQ